MKVATGSKGNNNNNNNKRVGVALVLLQKIHHGC
jgi:hypothetical protein